MVNVIIVEDSNFTSNSIKDQLEATKRYHVKAIFKNAANAVTACLKGNVDLLLMDVCTEDDESGLNAAESIKKHSPEIKIVIMTSMPEYSFLEKAKSIGCESFWYKEYDNSELIEVCDRTLKGESVYPYEKPVIRIGKTDSTAFSQREFEMIRLLALGQKYSEIAESLNISENTVKFHVKKILAKTGYTSTMQLVVSVVESRLVLPKY